MCGINGHVASGDPRGAAVAVQRMNEALVHRGPDDGGLVALPFGALGMRRLSIVDLEHGHQPMISADRRFAIVYNGEIYDDEVLRNQLAGQGVRFRTRCDTEVVLEAFAAAGSASLASVNGMFAFAVAGLKSRELTLVRDPLGIKPLYYHHTAGGDLIFSSELKGLLAHPLVPRRLDRCSLAALLIDRYIADPWTLLEGVYQLPPGCLLRWKNGRIEVEAYYELQLTSGPNRSAGYLEELEQILSNVVRSQLAADVPVGILLSGGIDSSTVAAYARRNHAGRIQSFSVGFSRPGYDESPLARRVAAYLDLEHHELPLEDGTFDEEVLDQVIDHVGQPLGDVSCIPTLMVSRLARRHVKVVLSGDGGDELFGGYDYIFWAARVRRVAEWVPQSIRFAAAQLLAVLARAPLGRSAALVRRARKGLDLTFASPRQQLRGLLALWNEDQVASLLHEGETIAPRSPFERLPHSLDELSTEEFVMAALTKTKLPGAILTKVDRMSMAAGLEVRPPLLDRRVVEFAARLPLDQKIRRGIGKHLLREAGRRLLPAEVYRHPKQGFSLPLAAWLNGRFWELLHDLYIPGSPGASLFDRRRLERVFRDGRRAGQDQAVISDHSAVARVWQLAMVGRWIERFRVSV
jgi:asparagine synthase (glutamine-hydrolysing)